MPARLLSEKPEASSFGARCCVDSLGVLGDERSDLGLRGDGGVHRTEAGVRVEDGGGDAVENPALEEVEAESDNDVRHRHLRRREKGHFPTRKTQNAGGQSAGEVDAQEDCLTTVSQSVYEVHHKKRGGVIVIARENQRRGEDSEEKLVNELDTDRSINLESAGRC